MKLEACKVLSMLTPEVLDVGTAPGRAREQRPGGDCACKYSSRMGPQFMHMSFMADRICMLDLDSKPEQLAAVHAC